MKVRSQRIIFSYLLLELVLLNLSFFFVGLFKYHGHGVFFPQEKHLWLLAIFNLSYFITSVVIGSSDYFVQQSIKKRLTDQFRSLLTLTGIASPIILLFSPEPARTLVFGTLLLFFCLDFLGYMISSRWQHMKIKSPVVWGSRLLVLGAGGAGQHVFDFVQKNRHLGFKMVGYLDDQLSMGLGAPVLGTIHDLPEVLATKPVDEIIITLPSHEQESIDYAIETADYHGIRVNLVPDYMRALHTTPSYGAYQIADMPVIELRQNPLDQFHNFLMKKSFDLIFSFLALLFLSPVLFFIAIAIYFDDKGPVFYKPIRKGQGGHNFTCYKFRTMYVNLEGKTPKTSTQKDDPRITRVGRFLRKYSLDELPQFLNVLEGNMSVVGPRPHRVDLNDDMQHSIRNYMVRHYVKPGITGWAQVNGWRGPTETEEQKQERLNHDLFYINHWNFLLDLQIVWRTVFSSKTHKNAF